MAFFTACDKLQWSSVAARGKLQWPRPELSPARDVLPHGKLGPRLFHVRARIDQLMGRMWGRTQETATRYGVARLPGAKP